MNAVTSGRARAALVFDLGGTREAVITAIVAKAEEPAGKERIRFAGRAGFHEDTRKHLSEVVLPIVVEVTSGLQLPERSFELSIENVGGASVHDLGLEISGLSADVPAFLALLSAALCIPVPKDLVATGHITSRGGGIGGDGAGDSGRAETIGTGLGT